MKLFVKSLKGNHFQIQVNPHDTVGDVKKNIESVQGANVYPVSQQMLIYQGKALMDGTTLEENKVAENSFIVVMLLKSKSFAGNSSVVASAIPTSKGHATPKSPVKECASSSPLVTEASSLASTPNSMPSPKTITEGPTPKLLPAPITLVEESSCKSLPAPNSLAESSTPKSALALKSTPESTPAPKCLAGTPTSSSKPVKNASLSAPMPAKLPTPKSPSMVATSPSTIATGESSSCATRKIKIPTPKSPSQASASPSTAVTSPPLIASTPKLPASTKSSSVSGSDIIGQEASNGLEITIQRIIDIGGGIWDRDTVESTLCAACNDPERAIDYLYSEIPKQTAVPSHGQSIKGTNPTKPTSLPSSRPTSGQSDIVPPVFLHLGSDASPMGALDFLRNSEQFQVLRAMAQANPQVLQPMLQEFGQRNPNLMKLIREHKSEFQQLLNEPFEGEEGNIIRQFSDAMPQAIQVTSKEHSAIERLEAMGFDRSTVLEAYFACNKNEALTANYLLDHMHEFEY